jgi:hypothetical protein
VVVVFSLAVGTVLDTAMALCRGKGTGELSLFRSLADVLETGDVLLGDRLYATYWEIARAQACGADVVLRLHAGRKALRFRGRGQSTTNLCVCWLKPKRPSWLTVAEYGQLPAKLRLRAVRVEVRRPGFRTRRLVLLTTLRDAAAVTRADLADLYRRRWQAELNLRSLKQTLQMDILRGKTPATVRKEMWAHLLVYNVVRTVMAQAAALAGVRPDAVSFAGALQTLNAFLPHLRSAQTVAAAATLWQVLLWAIATHRVGERPNRYEPRAVKRRPKKYPHLKEPQAQARRRLRKRAKHVGKKR